MSGNSIVGWKRAVGWFAAAAVGAGLLSPAAFALDTASAVGEPLETMETETTLDLQDGTYVPGQAIVVYHEQLDEEDGESTAQDAEPSLDDMALELEGEPLDDAGFTVRQTWDFSICDEFDDGEPSAESLDDGDGTVWETLDGIPSGDDVRIALVSEPYTSTEELIAELEQLDFVESAEPNYLMEFEDAYPTNDPLVPMQYPVLNGDGGINLQAALDAAGEVTDTNVVAVIDTGVDYTHPDLVDSMWTGGDELAAQGIPSGTYGYDFGAGDTDPMPTCEGCAHGTHVAGIIAATADNGIGVTGVSASSEIMALKAASDNLGMMTMSALVGSFQYVIAAKLAGVNVAAINYSIGSYGAETTAENYAVTQAGKAGVLTVQAAGNDCVDADDPDNLSAGETRQTPYLLVVAATNDENEYALFTDYGRTSVDVGAPGVSVLSTVPVAETADYAQADFSALENGAIYSMPMEDLAPTVHYAPIEEARQVSDGEIVYAVGRQDAESETFADDEEAAAATSVEAVERNGETVIKVTVDPALLDDPSSIKDLYINFLWRDDNPFFGMSDEDAASTIGGLASIGWSDDSPIAAGLFSSLGLGNDTMAMFHYDWEALFNKQRGNGGSGSGEPDTASEQVLFVDSIQLKPSTYYEMEDGAWTFYAGRPIIAQDMAPYGYMSGTSMSAPVVAGMVGELAALYPDASALELRGMIVGGTTPVDDNPWHTYDDIIDTATDGRVDYGVILNGHINANAWSLSVDAASGDAILEGYHLSNAALAVDGADVGSVADGRLQFSGDEDGIGWLAFSLADLDGDLKAILDGDEHWFTVTDMDSGRTHEGSYTVPLVNEESVLMQAIELPEGFVGAATGSLVTKSDGLFLADASDGSYAWEWTGMLEQTTNEDEMDAVAAIGEWTELEAPGVPDCTGYAAACTADRVQFVGIQYEQMDGNLVALGYVTLTNEDATVSTSVQYYANVYDRERQAWSGWTWLWTLDEDWMNIGDRDLALFESYAISMTAYDGRMWVVAEEYMCDDEYDFLFTRLVSFDPADLSDAKLEAFTDLEPVPMDIGVGSGTLVRTGDGLGWMQLVTFLDEETGDESFNVWGASLTGDDSLLLHEPASEPIATVFADTGDDSVDDGWVDDDWTDDELWLDGEIWIDEGLVEGLGDFSYHDAFTLFSGDEPMRIANGAILYNVGMAAVGDAVAIQRSVDGDTATWTATPLGNAGFTGGNGVAAVSGTMIGDVPCFLAVPQNAVDGNANVAGAIYAMVGSAAESLRGFETTVTAGIADAAALPSAQNEERTVADDSAGGTATVEDWRGVSGTTIMALAKDHATWQASAADGYRFAGWLDPVSGDIVSAAERYTAPIDSLRELDAVFVADDGDGDDPSGDGSGGSSGSSSGDSTSDGTTGGTSSGGSSSSTTTASGSSAPRKATASAKSGTVKTPSVSSLARTGSAIALIAAVGVTLLLGGTMLLRRKRD